MSQAALPHSHAGHPARTLIRNVDDLNTEVERPKVAEPGPTATAPNRPVSAPRANENDKAASKVQQPFVDSRKETDARRRHSLKRESINYYSTCPILPVLVRNAKLRVA